MTRALSGSLSEFDYLVLSDDRTRQGALRFLGDDMEPLSDLTPPIPRLVELERLRARSRSGSSAIPAARWKRPATLRVLPAPSAALARRLMWKATGISGLPSSPRRRTPGRSNAVEVATLKLAAKCGLRAAEAKLELRDSDSPIALIRRFDRRGDTRIPYISARTALDWQGDEGGYYTDIADVIRQISSKPIG